MAKYHSKRQSGRSSEYGRNSIKAAASLIAAILSLVVSVTPAHADSLRIELGTARTGFHPAGDNIWFDQTYPHDNRLRVWGGILGASGEFDGLTRGKWSIGWRAWAIDFGRTSNSGVWPSDEDYFAHLNVDPIYQGNGSGRAYGVSLAPTLNYHPTSDTQLSIEGGILVYRASWSEQVQKLDANGQGVGPWMNMTECPNCAGSDTDWTIYGGVSARYRWLFVSYRKYRDIHGYNSVFGEATKQLVIGLSLSFR